MTLIQLRFHLIVHNDPGRVTLHKVLLAFARSLLLVSAETLLATEPHGVLVVK